MSLLRHREIYHHDGWIRASGNATVEGRGPVGATSDHRCDEFPADYSLAGCAPAEPTSASPVVVRIGGPIRRDNRSAANGLLSLFAVSHGGGPLQTHCFFRKRAWRAIAQGTRNVDKSAYAGNPTALFTIAIELQKRLRS